MHPNLQPPTIEEILEKIHTLSQELKTFRIQDKEVNQTGFLPKIIILRRTIDLTLHKIEILESVKLNLLTKYTDLVDNTIRYLILQ